MGSLLKKNMHDTKDVLEWEAGQWKQSQITVAPADAFDVWQFTFDDENPRPKTDE